MIPRVIGEVAASRSPSPLISTPAFASANSGTTTKLVQGWKRCCSRSFGDTVSATVRLAVRASAGEGCSRNSRHVLPAWERSSRVGGYAVAIRPMATPAIVACTPDARVANQTPKPARK